MTVNQFFKTNIAGMQVIKTLLMLLEDNYTMSELVQNLNNAEKEAIFNNNVISKYINTCRYCGVEIAKIHNKYFVTKLPFGLNLTTTELDLLYDLQSLAAEKFTSKFLNNFKNFIFKLNKFSNKNIIKVNKKNIDLTCEIFTKAIENKRRILIMHKKGSLIECNPIAIVEYKGRKSLKVLYKNKERHISINNVVGLELLGKIFIAEEYSEQEVVYKLTGGLAQRYSLRENEKEIARNLPNYIIISNKGEGKLDLILRLLRYDKYCEILKPQEYRNEIKEILDNMLANYGE